MAEYDWQEHWRLMAQRERELHDGSAQREKGLRTLATRQFQAFGWRFLLGVTMVTYPFLYGRWCDSNYDWLRGELSDPRWALAPMLALLFCGQYFLHRAAPFGRAGFKAMREADQLYGSRCRLSQGTEISDFPWPKFVRHTAEQIARMEPEVGRNFLGGLGMLLMSGMLTYGLFQWVLGWNLDLNQFWIWGYQLLLVQVIIFGLAVSYGFFSRFNTFQTEIERLESSRASAHPIQFQPGWHVT